jgi:peptidoglycan/xylan/chitin deacetylase (PgdA/CDA1 family)
VSLKDRLRPALKSGKLHSLHLLESLGGLDHFRDSAWRRRRLLILCYHGIALDDEHLWKPSMYLQPSTLRARFQALRDGGVAVLPLDEAVRRLYESTLPPRAVALTFDDGTHDFHEAAWPLLREFGFPATVYLTTYYCQHPYPVFPLLWGYLFWKARGRIVDTVHGSLDLSSQPGRESALAQVVSMARERRMTQDGKLELSRGLAGNLAVDLESILARKILRIMRPEQVREIAAAGIDIQLHTHRHRLPLDRENFRREIDENRAMIQDLTGRNPEHFCYPSGQTHVSALPWLAEQGVRSATTCEPGLASAASAPLLLPRYVDTSRVHPIEFQAWVAGVGSILPAFG